jgi:hypothetical protein
VHAAINALIAGVRSWLAGLDLVESGRALIRSLAQGVRAAAGELYQSVKDTVAKARNLLPFSDAREGPLSTLTVSGRRLVETLGAGVQSAEGGLLGPLRGLLRGAADVVGRGLPALAPAQNDGAGPPRAAIAPLADLLRGAADLVGRGLPALAPTPAPAQNDSAGPPRAVLAPLADLLRGAADLVGRGLPALAPAQNDGAGPPRAAIAPLADLLRGAAALVGRGLPALAPAAAPAGIGGLSPAPAPGTAPTLAPVLNVHISIAGARDPQSTADAVVSALRARGTDLMIELERALEDVWRRQAFRTYGT